MLLKELADLPLKGQSAFNKALVFETVRDFAEYDEATNTYTFKTPDLVRFSKVVAMKVCHNIENGARPVSKKEL